MLVGGYAVVHYGYHRTTGDMDIWFNLGDKNKARLIAALVDFGIRDEDITELQAMDFTRPLPVFSLEKSLAELILSRRLAISVLVKL